MKKRKIIALILCLVLFVCVHTNGISVCAAEKDAADQPASCSDFRKEELTLYAKGAVLLDCSSQRILYGKNADTPMPNASTTKILTCILALENGKPDDIVTVSDYACKMPKVKLGFTTGDTFYLKDLLYSLMLESHNDTAVAIAEHISGSVEAFAELMNKKAKELGCENSHFVTPNGLDKSDDGGEHSTTAYDLSRIMSYCIKNDEFLEITRTQSKQIQNVKGTKSYSLNNHNALLQMVDGAVSGKTGFTGNAGYCYVGAYEKDGRTYAFALLACGWPNNKGYKWVDAKKLIAFGNEKYEKKIVAEEPREFNLRLKQAVIYDHGYVYPENVHAAVREKKMEMLLSDADKITVDYDLPKSLNAPVQAGDVIGEEKIYLNQSLIASREIYLTEGAQQFNFFWCLRQVFLKAEI